MKLKSVPLLLCLAMLLLSGCMRQVTHTPIAPTKLPTESDQIGEESGLPTSIPTRTRIPTRTPHPSPTPDPNTLTICLGAEPDNLFLYGGSMLVKSSVLEAIYDGPIDALGYRYRPVILEKLPSLADGDALIEAVSVQEGDWVVADNGELVQLNHGEKVRPAGCNRPDCAIEWNGGPLQMAQLSAYFTLVEGLKWSDGQSLTAYDSAYSYQIARQCLDLPGCYGGGPVGRGTIERTAAYTALDERITRWTGLPGFLDPQYATNFFQPLPRHQLSDLSIEEMNNAEKTARTPLGWGPYIIDEWRYGEYIRLNKNPHYFRAVEGLPRFERLVFRFTGENSPANIEALLSKKCAIVDQDASLDDAIPQLLELDAQGLLQAHLTTGTVWEHADFSIGHADYDDGYQAGVDRPDFFGDVRTRQAIALCMDRQRVINELLFGLSLAPDSYLPAGHPLYNPEVSRYSYDPRAGIALLEQVGWVDHDDNPATARVARGVDKVPEGTLLAFAYATTTAALRQEATVILAESLAQCGIQVELMYYPASDFFTDPPVGELFSRRFDSAQFAWLAGVQPPCELFMSENIPGDPEATGADGKPRFPKGWAGQNNSGYSNPAFDEACRAAREALPGQPGYVENHLKAQEIFAADLPVVPLFLRLKVTAARADLCGYAMDSTMNSDTWNIEEYGIGEECQ